MLFSFLNLPLKFSAFLYYISTTEIIYCPAAGRDTLPLSQPEGMLLARLSVARRSAPQPASQRLQKSFKINMIYISEMDCSTRPSVIQFLSSKRVLSTTLACCWRFCRCFSKLFSKARMLWQRSIALMKSCQSVISDGDAILTELEQTL